MAEISGRRSRASAVAIVVGLVATLLCLAGGGLIAALGNGPLPLDVAWYDISNHSRSQLILELSRFLNDAGAQVIVGVIIPIIATILFAVLGRGWASVAVLLCGIGSAPLVNAIKSVFERPRPDNQLVSVTLSAYPSGHVANLTAVLVVLSLLLAWRWFGVLTVVLVVAMALSRTYLNVHWLTDDIAGVLLGAGLALVVWGSLRGRILAERKSLASA